MGIAAFKTNRAEARKFAAQTIEGFRMRLDYRSIAWNLHPFGTERVKIDDRQNFALSRIEWIPKVGCQPLGLAIN